MSGLCSTPPAVPGTVALSAQKYSAESCQWAENFLRLKEKITALKFSHEASNALNHGVPWKVLEEQLGSLPGVLDVPEEIGSCTVGIVTLQLQWGSFRDQNRVIRLGPWLASGISQGKYHPQYWDEQQQQGWAVETLWSLFWMISPEQTGKWQEKEV